MEKLLQDVLLVLAVLVPPSILLVLLRYGLAMKARPPKLLDGKKPTDSKHPYGLQP
jgi:hypothetical protein